LYIRTVSIVRTGATIRVTPYRISRWVKAFFLLVLGIVILFYADKLVDDIRAALEGHYEVAFQWTWGLMTWLLWVLVAWLFVDAGLTIALSFNEQTNTIGDVARRLERIEEKLGMVGTECRESTSHEEAKALIEEPYREQAPAPDEVPPPSAVPCPPSSDSSYSDTSTIGPCSAWPP
jgi:hypothetical protein